MTCVKMFSVTCPNDHKNLVNETMVTCPTCNHKLSFDWKINFIERKTDVDKNKVFQRLIEWLDKKGFYVDVYNGCNEPGYDDKTVIAANWNELKKVGDWIESYFDDISLEWSDEWTSCSDCYNAIRTSADCYSWEPYYIWSSDCSISCLDCVKDDLNAYLDLYLNNSESAIPSALIEAAKNIGFKEVENLPQFEHGMHYGQNDTPEKVLNAVCDLVGTEWFYSNQDYIFYIKERSQFYITFSILTRKKEMD